MSGLRKIAWAIAKGIARYNIAYHTTPGAASCIEFQSSQKLIHHLQRLMSMAVVRIDTTAL
jgi:hypothetical protein